MCLYYASVLYNYSHFVCLLVFIKGGWTALHYAAREGHLEILKFLLIHGADTSVKTNARIIKITCTCHVFILYFHLI